ncbi:Tethering factor for nuclear proteasome sts1 [Coemansia sp. RSA 1813]|nr:Tethering factor for nuclear proteasome sts1 [Coemansia sp. RSA 1646]KAJ1774016.1 Tethering factor for nuclear proteasome sts1 [Coemansia sp. RSA 1843]KAJ2092593.1 Tethering factor for nuclear proteasome sts1 [Coemansia sp. RSA 986]KAJ2216712.1 Tethering factor for nuclear proteasome sts1 [Coemansia sp. RSA 487]KAJ2572786.1 Tethering factor for nuclear proteasome sts1 [Coemansia sp. RSA 1813]
MSQQAHYWNSSALAATFSSHSGFNGTAWGAARASTRINGDINCGLGFGQSSMLGNPVNNSMLSSFGSSSHLDDPHSMYEPTSRRQKRKASSEDESMDSPSPTPEPAARKFRTVSEARRLVPDSENSVAAVINSASFGRRQYGVHFANASGSRMAASSYVDGRKRTRMMDATMPNEVSLDKLLEPLEDKDLRSLLDSLISQNPGLASQVRQLVPKPTVNSACRQLARLERRLQAAFPYNKAGTVSDDYTYHRVKPALEELRDTIVMYLDHFTHYGLVSSSENATKDSRTDCLEQPANALSHPAEWFDLLTQATDVAVRMPKWDKIENNDIKRETLRLLADGWLRATMATSRWTEEGHLVGRDMLLQWAQQLEHFGSNCGEPLLFQPAIKGFQRSFGQYCSRGSSGSRLPPPLLADL